MTLSTNAKAPITIFSDANGREVKVGDGTPALVAFFRDARCPFCHYRIFELSKNFDKLAEKGLDVVAVFSSDKSDVNEFISKRDLPFPVVADADLHLHNSYGITSDALSMSKKMPMMLAHFFKMLKGMMLVGPMNAMKSDSIILPADFLVTADGKIAETYYSKDYAERMPLKQIFSFADKNG